MMAHRRSSAFIGGLILLLTGCTTTVTPPAHVSDPTTIYLKMDARHSGIVFPRSEYQYVEYSFGAFRWFALADTRWPVAVGSLSGFMQSTLQTNELPVVDGRPAAIPQVKLVPIIVERSRADALRMELDARFARQIHTYVYNELYDMSFVEDAEHYWVFNNCNQVTGRWLARLGCGVNGSALTNEFLVSPR